jgi:hypothetical protein
MAQRAAEIVIERLGSDLAVVRLVGRGRARRLRAETDSQPHLAAPHPASRGRVGDHKGELDAWVPRRGGRRFDAVRPGT